MLKSINIRALCIYTFILLFILMTLSYIRVRLELIESRHLHASSFLNAAKARRFIIEGDTNSACRVINDGLRRVVQYAIRREVMDSYLNSRLRSIVVRDEVELSDVERGLFEHYYSNIYLEWSSSSWLDNDVPPLFSQLEYVLYSRWTDRCELWTTWKPRDIETNIELR